MHEFLVFQIYGPMQAWGDIAVGEIRPVMDHPGRSGVAGLLAAALGLTRDGTDAEAYLRMARSLRIAVRADVSGATLNDYHTTQTPGKTKNVEFATRQEELMHRHQNLIPTSRHYTQDGAFTACLSLTEPIGWTLGALAEALRRPRFTVYLGRKTCPPSLPFNPLLKTFDTIEEALGEYPAADAFLNRLLRRESAAAPVWWDIDMPTRISMLGEVTRRDVPESRQGQFRFLRRTERYGRIPAQPEVLHVS